MSVCAGFSVFGVVVFIMITCFVCCLIYARHRRRTMAATNQPHYQAINLQPGPPPGELRTHYNKSVAQINHAITTFNLFLAHDCIYVECTMC